MSYAEVAVDAPIGCDRTLSYSVAPGLNLEPGQMVWVPLGQRPVQGIVVQLASQPQVDATKDVIAAVEPSALIPPLGLQLARWISRYYLSSLFDAMALMLPPGFPNRVRSYVRSAPQAKGTYVKLNPKQSAALDYLAAQGRVKESELVSVMGKNGERELRWLLTKGILQREWELPRPKLSHRYECFIRPIVSNLQSEERMHLPGERAYKQKALYDALSLSDEFIPLNLAHKEYGATAVRGLLEKGLFALEWVRLDPGPTTKEREGKVPTHSPIIMTPAQKRSLAEITAALEGASGAPEHFLIHGVTGSGKTEVYLRALDRCVKLGKAGIFLLPEIALAPQTVHRLNAWFPGRVAVMHSRLSSRQRFDHWWRIKDGDYDVVVGPRSALFAPLPNLGLIVMDEEHEWTYKQQDAAPRYHARDVAMKLAELSGAAVVMGSATPDVETYARAGTGEYRLLELPQRVSPSSGIKNWPAALAQVEVCDMRQELKEGNRSITSRALASALSHCMDKGEQAILFLNRRGTAAVVQCRDCGYVARCPRCSVTLTYHAADMRLLCHHCNRRSPVPRGCPQCRSQRIRYLGLGTQRVMEDLGRLLPDVRVVRWDGDSARAPHAHERIMERFQKGEAQILIGTQMVAKGLHVPNVTLVGVILADIGLNLPDFRAGERVFQLLCQVAGRAGRGVLPGKVIIQTYNPNHYAVEAAAKQDYGLLYKKEIQFRRQQANPPFGRLIHLVYLHTNSSFCQREAQRMGRALRQKAYSLGLTDVDVVGPAPAFPERVLGRYRWHVILRGRNLHAFLEEVAIPQGWTVDVDPVSVL